MGSKVKSKDEDIRVEENGTNENSMSNEKALSNIEKAAQNGNRTRAWVKLFGEVAEKSGEVFKTSASKVGDFTTHATHIAKLKLDAHKLNNELGKLILETGHKLWELHKAQNLQQVEDLFSDDFKKIASIEEKLQEIQNELQN